MHMGVEIWLLGEKNIELILTNNGIEECGVHIYY
jgi:hypothetical protein